MPNAPWKKAPSCLVVIATNKPKGSAWTMVPPGRDIPKWWSLNLHWVKYAAGCWIELRHNRLTHWKHVGLGLQYVLRIWILALDTTGCMPWTNNNNWLSILKIIDGLPIKTIDLIQSGGNENWMLLRAVPSVILEKSSKALPGQPLIEAKIIDKRYGWALSSELMGISYRIDRHKKNPAGNTHDSWPIHHDESPSTNL